jgi:hypothetical protein
MLHGKLVCSEMADCGLLTFVQAVQHRTTTLKFLTFVPYFEDAQLFSVSLFYSKLFPGCDKLYLPTYLTN